MNAEQVKNDPEKAMVMRKGNRNKKRAVELHTYK